MQRIMLDIEWTCDNRCFTNNEIIEIAAMKLDNNLQEIESFHTYVRPRSKSFLTTFTTKLTGITNNDIKSAPDFPTAFEMLRKFVGDEDTLFIMWGTNDEAVLKRHVYSYGLNQQNKKWFNALEFKDLQQDYDTMACSRKLTSVTDALINFGDKYEGSKHRALNDVFNTCKIYRFMRTYDPGLIA